MHNKNQPHLSEIYLKDFLRKRFRKVFLILHSCPMKSVLYFTGITFFIFHFSIANAIEVGGHLTEDTTWSPDNNPYLVTEILYVDSGVTLTILPGTEIKVSGASCTSWQDMNQNFWLYDSVSIAKFIQIDGKIIAEGTEQDTIIFTIMQDIPNYNWGTIYITEDAELCRFKYCKIENSCVIGIAVSYISKGLAFFNGKGSVRNCDFVNNAVGISSSSFSKNIEIINNNFLINNNINPFLLSLWKNHIMSYRNVNSDSPDLLVCNNNFTGYDSYCTTISRHISFAQNNISNCSETDAIGYYYDNTFNNCDYAIRTGSEGDSLYIKNNRFIGGIDGININHAYVEISDNYFEGCDLDTGLQCSGKVFNNMIEEGNVRTSGYLEVYNNIGFAGEDGIIVTYRNEMCNNNLSIQNQYAFDGAFSSFFNNCIFIANEEISNNGVSGNPIFRNCILDFELPPECIDGGGNIWVDSLQAQTLFEDIQNGDFHLIEGSLAIDAGFDTLSYYYPFDMDYNHRVCDGNNNGSAIIDIGPYEYNSPALGGIEGNTYNPINGDPVDYVLLKINNQPGEFTFTDSLGNFQYKLPAGTYDVYAERVFYEDVIEYEVEVFDGQFTQVLIPMLETVDVDDNVIPKSEFLISNLANFPNPFNPSTSISFSLTTEFTESTELIIYNLKGQKVKTLECGESLSTTADGVGYSISWNGTDSNNKSVASGIYLYRLSTGKSSATKKMLLLK